MGGGGGGGVRDGGKQVRQINNFFVLINKILVRERQREVKWVLIQYPSQGMAIVVRI